MDHQDKLLSYWLMSFRSSGLLLLSFLSCLLMVSKYLNSGYSASKLASMID